MKTVLGNLLKLQSLEFEAPSKAQPEIARLRARIPSAMLGHYDRFVGRGKRGIAVVNHGVCSGCHMRVPLGKVVALLRAKQPEMCDNCGRYLYSPESGNA